MKLTRLRIAGFKSFVEPTDFLIEPGLTGVVGPNGCGKSNLVEALRWVMGESSHKSLRASGMDDVIFAGSGNRPARNHAEVALHIDNAARTAPAAFNGDDALEVARRIDREEGSTYRVNGREVRARDVQLLFADAATGARSPAMVRQGQIGEIIAARPEARRRILEDAAGIAGLHARRHEAELRLKAAEDNLTRLEDVMREIDAQIDSLRKQGRQASRYKWLSAEIRKLEATSFLISYARARAQVTEAERALEADVRAVAGATGIQAEAAKNQAVAAAALPDLRNAEVSAAAALQRMIAARAELEAEEKRVKDRAAEIARRIVEIEKDIARESALSSDAAATIVRLAGEEAQLAKEAENEEERTFEAKAKLADAEGDLASEETALADVQSRLAALVARRDALKRAAGEAEERARRLGEERARVAAEFERLAGENGATERLEALASEKAAAEELVVAAEAAAAKAREAAVKAREADAASRVPLAEAERHAQRLETEARTLAKLLAPAAEGAWNPVLDTIHARKGFETALGAALGEDLDAPADPAAPTHWVDTLARASDPALPEGVKPLSDFVKAPGVLLRRLNQIGVVAREDGPRLRAELAPGQRLVSREGDLWRWDGYTAAADAPSAAARRLAEKNRLGDLEKEAAEARLACERLKIETDAAQAAAKQAAARDTELFEAARAARAALDRARAALADAERQAAETASRRSALTEALARIAASESEAQAESETRATELAGLADPARFESDMLKLRALVAERRAVAAEARVVVQNLQRESEARARRRTALAAEREQWTQRADRAAAARADMETRLAAAIRERDELATAPDTFHQRRRVLADEIAQAEARRSAAADKLAAAETSQAAADRAAREALDGLATAREARAGSEARLEAARTRLTDIVAAIADSLECGPNDLRERAGLAPEAETPSLETVESRLSSLRAERERLGGVNLRAEEELAEVETKRNGLATERDDLTEAIRRLRQAIGNLNREGRERLLAAFEVVNAHFQRLFTTLFGGGTAELRLVDSEDPLEAGLEILARPPGKKPQVMTLLSGGEQALTATALIFAVFLTNPSPICVLDEVDAPLDDANVERYCDLLVEMARETDTRFIVITHNPITMARMDRLFGVTMAERGVSQLVSVDLATAERFQEAV